MDQNKQTTPVDKTARTQSRNDQSQIYTTHTEPGETRDFVNTAGPEPKPFPTSTSTASAAAVNVVLGPPPQPERKTSWLERWRRDRRESKDLQKLGMPNQESSRQWRVGQVV